MNKKEGMDWKKKKQIAVGMTAIQFLVGVVFFGTWIVLTGDPFFDS